ncbi:MAG: mechanosensitive ion channel family protein, partial [Thermodesulfobacteriota bacterium]|nr:mechanosensitive ion channel family protein [Thermodesulfobacteriota bacterium]
MKGFLKGLYQEVFPESGPLPGYVMHVLAIATAAGLAWWIFNAVIGRVEKKYYDRPFFDKNKRIFMLIRRAGHYSIIILVGMELLDLFEARTAGRIVYAFMIILLSSIANSVVSILLPYLEQKIATKTESQIDDVIVDLSKKFSGVIIYATGAILALDVLGLNVMPFVAGAGVAGIAIGFAAKDTLSNLIAGILLIIDRPFEVGDRIEVWSAPVNSATWGDVLHIGLRATKIQTTDNIVIIIPNNQIMNRDIINYTAITKEIRVRIPIGIAYDSDINKAKEIIAGIALELNWVMKEPRPKVVVRSFGDSAVNLEARVWINEPRRRMDTISYITDRVKEAFEQEG